MDDQHVDDVRRALVALPPFISIDIEPTNRCNADCYFCPRDQTPHQGLMSPETFALALERSIELRDLAATSGRESKMSLCGMGEPLLNRHVPSFIADATAAGFEVMLNTNGALLDDRRSRAVLDAGLRCAAINVGEIGERYEEIFKLPWATTRDNILRFADMAEGRCDVQIIYVDHRSNPDHQAEVRRYWSDQGLTNFFTFPLINRGGALSIDERSFGALPQREVAQAMLEADGGRPLCPWPFASMVVGYDGNYYLCCSDWKKEVPLGTVADVAFADIVEEKIVQATSRASVCRECSMDPVNVLAAELQGEAEGRTPPMPLERLAESLRADSQTVAELVDAIDPGSLARAEATVRADAPRRNMIPVRSAG